MTETALLTMVPPGVATGTYEARAPLIHPSKLTTAERGGVGKDLSEGWCLNFATGCTHGCTFCYVDSINKMFAGGRFKNNEDAKELVKKTDWGDYFLIPDNLQQAIADTNWSKWRGKEVMMSSMHDPYLPELASWATKILEAALPVGVRFCIQTRSLLVLKDLQLLQRHASQVRLQVSIATMNQELSRRIEPRVPMPKRRLEVLRHAKAAGIKTGVILAPIFPPVGVRVDWQDDMTQLAEELRTIRPDHIYGESLHIRGKNVELVARRLGEPFDVSVLPDFDRAAGAYFHAVLKARGLEGTWWPEHKAHRTTNAKIVAP